MFEHRLGQTLIIEPQVPFEQIARTMQTLGWRRQENPRAAKSLITGEPEAATWSWEGKKPFVIYTFNPVVKMRVLDVATLPPGMRADIAKGLPMVDEIAVEKLFDSEDVRERLLALWAAQETERLDLVYKAQQLTRDKEPILAEQAKDVLVRLQRMNEARVNALANLKLLSDTAPQLIHNLNDWQYVQALKPEEADLYALFDENIVPVVRDGIEAIYRKKFSLPKPAGDAKIDVVAAPAGILRWPNPLSEKFPLGYRDIAGWMNPSKIWMTWTIATPSGAGQKKPPSRKSQSRAGQGSFSGNTTRYDGLVWLGNKWCWLPRIYRYLKPYLLEDASAASRKH